MKLRTAISTFSVAAAVSMAIAPMAPAYSDSYIVDTEGNPVFVGTVGDGFGTKDNCVQTTRWMEEEWSEACGKPAPPEPKVAEKPEEPEEPEATPAQTPAAAEVAPVEPTFEQISITGNAVFATNSASLTDEGKAAVDDVVEQLRSFDKVKTIAIVGHTDSTGAEAYNKKLSEKRANAVRDHLVSRGVNPALLSTSGMGESSPIADNKTKEGRQQNRRVEVNIDGSKIVSQ
jgi:OOP family OmpA-OmpF porin